MKDSVEVYNRSPDFILEVWLAPAGYQSRVRLGKKRKILWQTKNWPESIDKEIAYPRLLGRTMKVLAGLWKGGEDV